MLVSYRLMSHIIADMITVFEIAVAVQDCSFKHLILTIVLMTRLTEIIAQYHNRGNFLIVAIMVNPNSY